jgi:hypothetical protein
MVSKQVLARLLSIKCGAAKVEGLDTVQLQPTSKDADLTVAESNGIEESEAASRGLAIKCVGKDRYTVAEGGAKTRDAGQAAVLAAAELIGDASNVDWTITYPDGKEKTFKGHVSIDDNGGDKDSASAFSFTVTRSGAMSDVVAG